VGSKVAIACNVEVIVKSGGIVTVLVDNGLGVGVSVGTSLSEGAMSVFKDGIKVVCSVEFGWICSQHPVENSKINIKNTNKYLVVGKVFMFIPFRNYFESGTTGFRAPMQT
jgi:hypothetical protein